MELLFNKEAFSSSFKELLGFVDADIRFSRMKSALQIATDEIIDLISLSTYETLFTTNKDSEFREMIKYAVALKSYIIYAPTADLAVTNNGRLMRRDEHMVSAFEWQIEANDEALEVLYYRHLDRLLKYMQRNNLKINIEKYEHSALLVPNLDTFESFFNIEGSYYLYLKLLPAIREFEQNEILPRIGSQMLQDRQSLVSEGLWYFIQSACVNYAMAWGFLRLNIKLFPKGVWQTSKISNQGKNQKRGDKLEHIEASLVFSKDVEKTLLKIEQKIAEKNKKTTIQKNHEDLNIDIGFDCNSGFVDV